MNAVAGFELPPMASASTSAPASPSVRGDRPLIAHVVHRFDVGGLENGVVNLINHLPADRYDHAVIAMTEVTDFRQRVQRDGTRFFSMRKPPGHGLAIYRDLFGLFRALKPAIVHTRNIAASEAQLPAVLAGVRARVHGEHGWEVQDVSGGRGSHRLQRRMLRPLIHRHVALSGEIRRYLSDWIGVADHAIAQICNGVDTHRFAPRAVGAPRSPAAGFSAEDSFVIGTIGRLSPVKHQRLLIDAFARAVKRLGEESPALADRLRLWVVGDGPDRAMLESHAAATGLGNTIRMAGSRDDIPDLMRELDLFVLPSLAEGISNTILEAMASGLPVIATRVGGNAELVSAGVTGELVASDDAEAMATAICGYAIDRSRLRREGIAARESAVANFSIETMVARYAELYDGLLLPRHASTRGPARSVETPEPSHTH